MWPGCDGRFTQGHHIEFWAKGGETELGNLCNLRSYHHHLVHDGEFGVVRLADGRLRFTHPSGRKIPAVPARQEATGELAKVPLEGWEDQPKWGYTRVDLNYLIETAWTPPEGKTHPYWST